ncbi:MAG: FAD-dependent oxidoreductase, partial [Dehalococcoidia bacterium]
GDTIASALYAAGVRIFNRSFKYHRPRGLLCVSGRCPNCMMNVDGVPNVRTCVLPAAEGVRVRHQNAWPSLEHDALSILERFDRLMPVGFYYKTLIKPKATWHLAEPVIRRIAGLGRVDTSHVPEGEYEHLHLFTDVAVVGGGPAGCTAALEAAKHGLRVTLIDDQPSLGGHLRAETRVPLDGSEYSGLAGYEVARRLAEAAVSNPSITILSNATAFGLYEDKLLGVHHGRELVKLRCRRIVIATGAQEVPMVFPNNDLPGIMLSSAATQLANLYGVRPGQRGLMVTNSDQGLVAALELVEAGVQIVAVADSRASTQDGSALADTLRSKGISVLAPCTIRRAEGKKRVKAALIGRFEEGSFAGDGERVPCDFICLATGFDPATALLSQGDCKLVYDSLLGETVPSELAPGIYAAGEVTGLHDAEVALFQGRLAGLEAAISLQDPLDAQLAEEISTLRRQLEEAENSYRGRLSVNPLLTVPEPSRKKFVCVCEDVTEKDLHDAIREGFDDVQTLKRYSTVSMGPCQGKMCLKAYLGICAEDTGRSIGETGSTTPRPPVQPVPMGAIAGPGHMPFRHTSLHHKHIQMGGHMVEVGEWKRPHNYGSPMEEAKTVRERVGIIDVTTLGKLDVRGKDAPRLMYKVYTHHFSNLKVGRIRYGMICSDSGIILDDGTVTRLAEDRYYVTTGTGNIDLVAAWFRWWAAGTGMCAHVTNVTPGFAAINVAGPRARATLGKLTEIDLSPEGFRYMRSASGVLAGVPSLLMRIGFVGETGWEVHFPAEYGEY